MKKKLFSLLVLLMTAVSGAVAQSYEAKVFDVPASWTEDETYLSAADLPEDFVQITNDEAKALAVPDGTVLLIYGFDGDNIKVMIFISGTLVSEDEAPEVRSMFIEYQTNNVIICYTAPAESIELTSTDGETWTLASMPDYDVELEVEYYDEVTLTDGEAITGLDTYKGQEIWVNYTRSFTEGKASTVCLPFAYTKKSGDGSFYEFTGIELNGGEYVATMTEPVATTLKENTPYLYMPSATGSVDFSGAYTIPENLIADSYTSGDWTFKGTFATIEWDTPQTGIYGFSAQDIDDIYQGEFIKVGQYVRISPMRCYLQYGDGTSDWSGVRGKNRVAAKLPETIKVRLIGADGNVTAIGSLSTTTGEMTMDGAWYSINGTRLNGTPATKGIYVNNGKKVVIK